MKKLNRDQLVLAAEVVLIGALDRIEAQMPTNIPAEDCPHVDPAILRPELSWYAQGALEAAGMSLGVLYARLTDDGLSIGDALHCAGKFNDACERFVEDCWEDGGKAIYAALKAKRGTFNIREVLPKSYPNCLWHAEVFVDEVFSDYLANCTKTIVPNHS